jgi:glycosyltransferase involved in cell wall biosynthesis
MMNRWKTAGRLIYVHNAPIPSIAANAVQVAKMCSAFQQIGMDTTLVAPGGMLGSSEEIRATYGLATAINVQGVPQLPVPGRELIFGAVVGRRYGKVPGTLFYTRSVAIAYSLARTRNDVILELHGPVSSMRERLRRRFSRLVGSPRLACLVVISNALRRNILESFPEVHNRICVAHDGADSVSSRTPPRMLSGSFKVGYVGQLYPGKGMEIISAVAPLSSQSTFHIIGGSTDNIKYWRDKLQGQANVLFHGHVPHADTQSYISAMDVMIAPYSRVVRGVGGGDVNLADWMSPLKLFEYMAAGKAIVTSDLPVLREIVLHEHEAILCDPDKPERWAEVLNDLCLSSSRRVELGARAHERFAKQFTWEQRSRAILQYASSTAD